MPRWILQQVFENGRVIPQCLAAGGLDDHDQVAPAADNIQGARLVVEKAIEVFDRGADGLIQYGRKRLGRGGECGRFAGLQAVPFDQPVLFVLFEEGHDFEAVAFALALDEVDQVDAFGDAGPDLGLDC